MEKKRTAQNGISNSVNMLTYLAILAVAFTLAVPVKASAFEIMSSYWAPRLHVWAMTPGMTEIAASAPAATHDMAASDAVKPNTSTVNRYDNSAAQKIQEKKETTLTTPNPLTERVRPDTVTQPPPGKTPPPQKK
jgi:hypothetical protein